MRLLQQIDSQKLELSLARLVLAIRVRHEATDRGLYHNQIVPFQIINIHSPHSARSERFSGVPAFNKEDSLLRCSVSGLSCDS